MNDTTQTAVDPRTRAAGRRSEARFDALTAMYGKKGVGYPDGVWFAALSKKSVMRLERSALFGDDEWSALALDAIGPMVGGNARAKRWLFLQIRSKYLYTTVDEVGRIEFRVEDLLILALRDLEIEVVRAVRLREELDALSQFA